MHVDVTQADIDSGYPDDPQECPIANAIRRTLARDAGDVGVDGLRARIIGTDGVVDTLYALPPVAREFVRQFDDTHERIYRDELARELARIDSANPFDDDEPDRPSTLAMARALFQPFSFEMVKVAA